MKLIHRLEHELILVYLLHIHIGKGNGRRLSLLISIKIHKVQIECGFRNGRRSAAPVARSGGSLGLVVRRGDGTLGSLTDSYRHDTALHKRAERIRLCNVIADVLTHAPPLHTGSGRK